MPCSIACILPTSIYPHTTIGLPPRRINLHGVEDKNFVEVIIATHPMLKPQQNLLLPILRLDPHQRRQGRRLGTPMRKNERGERSTKDAFPNPDVLLRPAQRQKTEKSVGDRKTFVNVIVRACWVRAGEIKGYVETTPHSSNLTLAPREVIFTHTRARSKFFVVCCSLLSARTHAAPVWQMTGIPVFSTLQRLIERVSAICTVRFYSQFDKELYLTW